MHSTAMYSTAMHPTAMNSTVPSRPRSAVAAPPASVPRRLRSGPWNAAAAVCLLVGAVLHGVTAHAADRYVGPGCEYTSVQSAVDASADGDVVRVVSSVEHVGAVVVTGRSLRIVGGVVSCGSPVVSATTSVLRGTGTSRLISVVGGDGDVVELVALELLDGRAAGLRGGALRIAGPGLTVRASRLYVGDGDSGWNSASRGGGIAVVDGATLELRESRVTGNRASLSGGGIHAENATVFLDRTTLVGNRAGDDGGGLYAHASDVDGSSVVFHRNSTGLQPGDDGGGMAYTASARIRLDGVGYQLNSAFNGGAVACLDDGSGSHRASVLRGVYAATNTGLGAASAVFHDCPAGDLRIATLPTQPAALGTSVFLAHTQPGSIVAVLRGRLVLEGDPGAPVTFLDNASAELYGMIHAYPSGRLRLRHVALLHNHWETGSLVRTQGAAAMLEAGFLEVDNAFGGSSAQAVHVDGPASIVSSVFRRGSFDTLVRNDGDAPLLLESVVVDQLTVSDELVRSVGPLRIAHATVGRIATGSPLLSGAAELVVASSLLLESERLADTGFTSRVVDCVLAADPERLGPATRSGLLGDPDLHFVDRLNGDYRLLASSTAVDACDASVHLPGAVDVDGKPRIVVVRSTARPMDLGAHEVQAALFLDGFESGDASAWTIVD